MPYSKHHVFQIAFLIGGLLAFASTYAETPTNEDSVLVAIEQFKVLGDAQTEVADSISRKLFAILESESGFEMASAKSGSPEYVIKGSIFAEPARKFAALQVLNTKTNELVWSGNYEYTSITADMMAKDVLKVLSSAASSRQ